MRFELRMANFLWWHYLVLLSATVSQVYQAFLCRICSKTTQPFYFFVTPLMCCCWECEKRYPHLVVISGKACSIAQNQLITNTIGKHRKSIISTLAKIINEPGSRMCWSSKYWIDFSIVSHASLQQSTHNLTAGDTHLLHDTRC